MDSLYQLPLDLHWAIAVRPLLMVDPETPTLEVLSLLHQARRSSCCLLAPEPELEIIPSCVFVISQGDLVGIVTERDFVKLAALGEDLALQGPVQKIMSSPVITLHRHELQDVFAVLRLFHDHQIRHLPIVEPGGEVVGCITEHSLRRGLRSIDLLRWRRVGEVMENTSITAPASTSILAVAQLMSQHHLSTLILMEPDQGGAPSQPVGMITERDILQFQALGLDLEQTSARTVMSCPLISVGAEDSLEQAYKLMQNRRIQRLVVVGDRQQLVGLLTHSSILRVFDPGEMYAIMQVLQQKVELLETEKLKFLSSRNQQLEEIIAQQTQELQSQLQKEQLVNEIAFKIRNNLELSQILDTAVTEIRAFFQTDRLLVYQFGENYRGTIVAESVADGWVKTLDQQIEDCCFDQGLSERYLCGDYFAISNVATAELTPCHRGLLGSFNVQANLVMPIIIRDWEKINSSDFQHKNNVVWGLLIAHQCSAPRLWQAGEIDFMRKLAEQLAIAVQHANSLMRANLEIEERVKRESEVKKLQDRLALVMQGSRDGWWDYDLKTGELYISPSWWQMLGYGEGELAPTMDNWHRLIHPDDLDLVCQGFAAAIAPGSEDTAELEYRLRHKDGHYVYVLSRGYTQRNEQGQPQRNSGTNTDLTPLKQKEQALHIALERLYHLNEELEKRVRERTQSLEESESRFRTIIESISDGILVLDRQGRIIFTNPVAAQMFNRSPQQLLGFELGTPISKNGAFDLNIHRSNGDLGIAECLVAAIQWQGQGASILCLRDVTERKEIELKYKQENSFRKQILENMAEGLCVCRAIECFPYVEFVLWNPQMEILTGYSQAEINEKGWYQSLYPDPDYQRLARERMERMRTGDNLKSESWQITRRDGQVRTISISTALVYDPKGKVNILAVIQDISDRKLAEMRLRESEQRYRALLEKASDPILISDMEGNLLEVNQKALDLLGYDLTEIGQLNMQDLHEPEHREVYIQAFQKIVREGMGQFLDGEVKRKDGSIVPVDITGGVVTWGDRQVVQGIFRDITERKQVEKQLQQSYEQLALSNAELARATRLKDEFLANMSHELRTPLNAVLGMTQSLTAEILGPLNAKQKKAIATIETSGEHLLALITDILDLSKVEAGKLELEIAPVFLPVICQTCLQFVQQLAFKKQIHLNSELSAAPLHFLADERRLRQILINLLNNAVKFTPNGGQVTLRVRLKDTGKSPWLEFQVLDTGIGIAPEDQTRLFQAFVQIDSNLNRKYEGTGLGLALVKRLTELHHGQVSLQSQLGQGSCFTVTLPYQPVPGHSLTPQPLAPMTATFQNDLQTPLVLVVEDNEANILSLKDYLEYKGFSLHCASNGQEALDFLAQQRPDIILMDVQMPIMDGMEASRRIRANPDWQSIPIIALTALTMPGDRERFLAAGMNEHVSKPVRLGELLSLINRLLAPKE